MAVALFLAPQAAQAQPAPVMAENASEPFSRADGSGYANDLVRAAFQAVHVQVRIDVVPYARCKQFLLRAKIPACFSMSSSPELPAQIRFSERPLFEVSADVYQPAATSTPYRDFAAIPAGARVGLINGYEYPDAVNRLKARGVRLEYNSSEDGNLKMLARGRLDAIIVMTSDFDRHSGRLDKTAMRLSFHGGTLQSFIAFNTAMPQGADLKRSFDIGHAAITTSGEKARIFARWAAALDRRRQP